MTAATVIGERNARPSARPGRTPRYATLARDLQHDIAAGHYAVGTLLPTEIELAQRHGVSRQTVRYAIAQLRRQGLLSARKGVGTRVESRDVPERFTYSALSAVDLVEMAAGSVLTIDRTDRVVARGALAAKLGCRPNREWLRLTCRRAVEAHRKPFAAVSTYIAAEVAAGLDLPPVHREALFRLVEQQSGETFSEIQQEIRATILTGPVAARLDAEAGTPALEITRRFFGTGRRLVLVAINTMPADRFVYSVAIARDI